LNGKTLSCSEPFPGTLGLIVLVALLSLFLAACGGPAPPAPAPQVEQAEVELSAMEHFERKQALACEPGREHWRAEGTPKRGGTFVRPNTRLDHLDISRPDGGSQYQPQVYEHLVETRACYYEDTTFVPGLAKAWKISPDGLTWTLALRADVRWHNKPPVNGRPFTADDVAWTIEHQKAGGALRSAWAPVRYEIPDPHTIVLRLPEPNPDFLGDVLAERNNFILAREVKEEYGDFKNMAVGTGPYMLKRYVPQQTVELERNPEWREKGFDGKPLPYIEDIQMPVLADYTAGVAATRAGQADLNYVTGFLRRDADALRAEKQLKLAMYQDVAPVPRGFWMDVSQPPFADVRLRRALALAIDHDEVIEGGYQGGAIRTGHLPAAIMDYAWAPTKVREKFKPDRERAKQLLVEAGYPPGSLKFTMKTGSVPQDVAGAEVVQNHFKLVGVEANIEQVPGFVATTIRRRDYHAAWGGMTPASLFPGRWMGGFLRCGDSRNVTNLCDQEIDRLSLAQEREIDPAKRKVILGQLQDKLFELMPTVPTQSLVYYRFYSCRVKNMPPTEWTQQLTGIARAWLDSSGC